MNCIDCSYNLLKDGHPNCTYEEGECIKISVLEKENAELREQIGKMKCCGNCRYFNITKDIGIGNLFCDLKLIKNEHCKDKDHWQFLRR